MNRRSKKQKNFFKAHKVTCLILLILIYLITGATVPFMYFPELRPETAEDFDPSVFRRGTPGVDRAALLETNESAWEERMRLLNRARERIVLSTFDMRPGRVPGTFWQYF